MDAMSRAGDGRRPRGRAPWSTVLEAVVSLACGIAMALLALIPNATLFPTFSVGVGVSALQALPVVLVRRWPIAAVALQCGGVVAASALAPDVRFPWSAASILVGIVVIGTAAARTSDRAAACCLAAIAATASVAVFRHHMPPGYFLAGLLAGATFVLLIRLIVHLRESSTRLQEERHLRAVDEIQRDAEAQRSALSAQVHDIVGHHLAAISLTATSQEGRASSSAEKDRALTEIASSAAVALSEIRSVLSGSPTQPHTDPGPAPDSLDGLIAAWEELGVRIEHRGTDVLDGVARPLRDEAYLVARQAITNAVQHGATKALRLAVTDEGPVVRLTIANAADHEEILPGRGLTGMRTRLEKNGHDLAIRTRDGVFELDVTLVKEA